MIHLSKIPETLHEVLGSMSQGLTDSPPGIWGFGFLGIHRCYTPVAPLGLCRSVKVPDPYAKQINVKSFSYCEKEE